ncbi:MAG: DUF559 domain-containing protein [Rickettsiales bacterium]|jgi:tRNA pseudouridine38-40 synthase|nr:DUF559 domain-containing protein [Rickettsiales bacterium]
MRFKLTLEYDGTDTIGWQENSTGVSVQSMVQDAIFQFCGEHVDVVGCGRTDAGVHALAMPAHFSLSLAERPQSASETQCDAGEGIVHHRTQNETIKNFATNMRNEMTRQEKTFWYAVNANKLGFPFRRQFNIDDRYIADFVCFEKRLIIEIDGSHHGADENEKIRTKYLQEQGFNVIRFWNHDIDKKLSWCLDVVKDALNNPPPTRITAPSTPPQGRGYSAETIMRAINFYLHDKPVAVLDCEHVADDFHARFDCRRRNYRYIILNRSSPAVLDKNRVWWIPRKLNIDAMRAAAQKFVGEHDWTSFRSSECQAKSPIKTLDEISITCHMSHVTINISARSFLHHQVRNIVGTLAEIGLGKPLDIDVIFAARDRSAAGPTAPAAGLYFVSAEY